MIVAIPASVKVLRLKQHLPISGSVWENSGTSPLETSTWGYVAGEFTLLPPWCTPILFWDLPQGLVLERKAALKKQRQGVRCVPRTVPIAPPGRSVLGKGLPSVPQELGSHFTFIKWSVGL